MSQQQCHQSVHVEQTHQVLFCFILFYNSPSRQYRDKNLLKQKRTCHCSHAYCKISFAHRLSHVAWTAQAFTHKPQSVYCNIVVKRNLHHQVILKKKLQSCPQLQKVLTSRCYISVFKYGWQLWINEFPFSTNDDDDSREMANNVHDWVYVNSHCLDIHVFVDSQIYYIVIDLLYM